MNDRYLFKAKRKNWKELPKEEWWVAGALLKSVYNDRAYIIHQCKMTETFDDGMGGFDALGYEVDPSTLCQCTDWKDKNKKLIFENDVVMYYGHKGVVRFGYYEWNEAENIGFYIEWEKVEYRQDLGYWLDKISVIGSVFDNPELLEVE